MFLYFPVTNLYFYHSNHLGSSSFITDVNGVTSQHLQYLPFGETFVEQRATANYFTPYMFSVKEKDEETSYSYFGARYLASDFSFWLSVDPMADDYPWQSPYMYCSGNPINRIDLNGMNDDEWELLIKKDGSIGVNKISDMGGKDLQIVNFSKENTNGDHEQIAKPIAINTTNESSVSSTNTTSTNTKGKESIWGKKVYGVSPTPNKNPSAFNKFMANTIVSSSYSFNWYYDNFGLGTLDSDNSTSDKLANATQVCAISIFIGGFKLDKEVFHKKTKPKILDKVGRENFGWKVGGNPNVNVKNGKIILEGRDMFKGKTYPTNINPSDFLKSK